MLTLKLKLKHYHTSRVLQTCVLHTWKSLSLITLVLSNIVKKLSGTYLFKYLDIQILPSIKILRERRSAGPGQ